jgi:hypothetical protein
MASKRWYFHSSQSTCAITAPGGTNCNSLSETVPDLGNTVASAISGGHLNHASASVQTIPPRSKPDTSEGTTTANTTVAIPAAQQLGWFSDVRYAGSMAAGTWTFTERWDDGRSAITGGSQVVLYACTTRDFTGTFRFLQVLDFSATDWWTGAASAGSAASPTFSGSAFTLSSEFLFARPVCKETVISGSGTHTFHQEGSDLTDSTRSNLLSPNFTPIFIPRQLVIQAVQRAAAW